MAINMKKEDDLGSEKVYQPDRSRSGENKNSRLTKALRDNLKKRKLQSKTRKMTKMIINGSHLIEE